jgi:hypothetical protein
MSNEATKIHDGQLILFSGGDAVEDLLYEFLKGRSPLMERAYQQDLKAFFEFTAKQFKTGPFDWARKLAQKDT